MSFFWASIDMLQWLYENGCHADVLILNHIISITFISTGNTLVSIWEYFCYVALINNKPSQLCLDGFGLLCVKANPDVELYISGVLFCKQWAQTLIFLCINILINSNVVLWNPPYTLQCVQTSDSKLSRLF